MNPVSQVLVQHNGETRTLSEWAKHLNMPWDTLRARYTRGTRGDKLFKPVTLDPTKGDAHLKHYLTIKGVTKTVPEWAKASGISYSVLLGRAKMGWEDDRILKPVGKSKPRVLREPRQPLPRCTDTTDLRQKFRDAVNESNKRSLTQQLRDVIEASHKKVIDHP
jgi:hypothetical protein